MEEQEFFKVRALSAENEKFIFTCGNMMASKKQEMGQDNKHIVTGKQIGRASCRERV